MGDLEHRLNRWCQTQINRVAAALEEKYENSKKTVSKADDSPDDQDDKDNPDDLQPELLLGGMELPPLQRHTIRALALLMWRAVDWRALSLEMKAYLEAAAEEGVSRGMAQVVDSLTEAEAKEVGEKATAEAIKQADDRAAEVIAMRWEEDGNLVPNPSAHWPLTDVMRRDFVATARQAVEENWSSSQVAAVMEAVYALSAERMEVVANAELAQMQSDGNYIVWTTSGVIAMVRWRTSDDPKRNTDECDDCEEQGIVPLGHEFFPGVYSPLLHPFCQCRLEAVPNSTM